MPKPDTVCYTTGNPFTNQTLAVNSIFSNPAFTFDDQIPFSIDTDEAVNQGFLDAVLRLSKASSSRRDGPLQI
jgi:hypothetical protein